MPTVSLILPVLNTVQFINERISSIVNQTYPDWNCIVLDGYSTDGSWELIHELVHNDQRFTLMRTPARGIYNAWNECIRNAAGEYIYIATSDDSMKLNCLEVMHQNLMAHPNCGIAHCCLNVIDANNEIIEHKWKDRPFTKYFGQWMNRKHIRQTPHDAMLHCFGATVYLSMNQLLIRRSVFANAGMFREDMGPMADYEWCMRASLLYPTLHIPEFLAMWRVHESQATKESALSTAQTFWRYNCMIRSAISHVERQSSQPPLPLFRNLLLRPTLERYMKLHFRDNRSVSSILNFFARILLTQPNNLLFCIDRLSRSLPEWTRRYDGHDAITLKYMDQDWIQRLLIPVEE